MEPPEAQTTALLLKAYSVYFRWKFRLPQHCQWSVTWTDQLHLKVNRKKEKTAFLLIKATSNWVSITVQCAPVCCFFCWTSQLQDGTFDLPKCFSKSGSNLESWLQAERSPGSVSRVVVNRGMWCKLYEHILANPGPQSTYVTQPIQDEVMCIVFVQPDLLCLAVLALQTQVQDWLHEPGLIYSDYCAYLSWPRGHISRERKPRSSISQKCKTGQKKRPNS